ncbi:zinc ABC transporter substrate-binding protein [Paracoccus sp. p3-h83]|uniref:zinc ABC transporter substrate-binding protein n=1 Tax=Paracoccus sp. p3-h83 TaxID=3342805 RepID=UPI0035B9E165
MTRPTAALPASFIAALALTAAPALAAPQVVTDIPAVQSLTAAVMQGVGEPALLLDRGASPHHFQLRPSQAAALDGADLVIWLSPHLTPWMARAVTALPKADAVLQLDQAPGLYTQAYGAEDDDGGHGGHDDHGHAHDHDHDHGHDHDHDGHDHSGTDPHLWLDPSNARLWLGVIRDRLAAIDPENAATYAANAERADAELAALDGELAAQLAPIKDKPFAVFHDAYGYFTGHYGLRPAVSVALGDAALPGAQRLAGLRDQMAEGHVACAFPEAQHDPKLIDQLIEGTAVTRGAALDPSGSTLEPGAALYPALLRGMAQVLTDCLAGK